MTSRKPRLLFVGPMLGTHAGHVTSQGEILASLLRDCGYSVAQTSSVRNRYVRLSDMLSTVVRLQHQVDAIVLMIYAGPSFVVEDAVSWIADRLGIPIIMHLHGGGLPAFIERFPVWTMRVFSRAAQFVAPSEFLASQVRKMGLYVSVIPNIIDISHYPFRQRSEVQPHLLWMRAFHSIYNPEMALLVLARVKQVFPAATLTMAGQDSGQQSEIEALATHLGLGDAVKFPGFLGLAGKLAAASNTDIFINTNRIDNQPVSLIEAGALGLPIVSTGVGGIPYLLKNGHTGLIVEDGDAAEMADAVLRLVSDPGLAHLLSINGRILAEEHSVSRVLPKWNQLLVDPGVVGQRRQTRRRLVL